MRVDTMAGPGSAEAKAMLLEDGARFDAQIKERDRLFGPELKPLLTTMVKRQCKGDTKGESLTFWHGRVGVLRNTIVAYQGNQARLSPKDFGADWPLRFQVQLLFPK
jgi:hypothetical protein